MSEESEVLQLTEKLQHKIAEDFDRLIPTEYKEAWLFFEAENGAAEFWFCYVDKATGNVIPRDGLIYRIDVVIKDKDMFEKSEANIPEDMFRLKKLYEIAGKSWYGCSLELKDGKYKLSFSHEKPEECFNVRKNNWCIEHFGMYPVVKVDMLGPDFPGHRH